MRRQLSLHGNHHHHHYYHHYNCLDFHLVSFLTPLHASTTITTTTTSHLIAINSNRLIDVISNDLIIGVLDSRALYFEGSLMKLIASHDGGSSGGGSDRRMKEATLVWGW